MTFRCNRLGNLFVKRVWIEIVWLYIAFLLIIGGVWLFADEFEWWGALFVLFIPTVISVFLLRGGPCEITYEAKRLIWIESLSVHNTPREVCKAVVTIGDLHCIEFLQTPIERLFNIGRIRFMGDIRSMEAPKDVERPEIPFCYGGIRKFDHCKECLQQNLPKSAFIH